MITRVKPVQVKLCGLNLFIRIAKFLQIVRYMEKLKDKAHILYEYIHEVWDKTGKFIPDHKSLYANKDCEGYVCRLKFDFGKRNNDGK